MYTHIDDEHYFNISYVVANFIFPCTKLIRYIVNTNTVAILNENSHNLYH